LFAVKAALEDGYVIGGGFALAKASHLIDLKFCENEWQIAGANIL
jgi:hypothetical protein